MDPRVLAQQVSMHGKDTVGLLMMLAIQELARHALSGGKQDHKAAFLLFPET